MIFTVQGFIFTTELAARLIFTQRKGQYFNEICAVQLCWEMKVIYISICKLVFYAATDLRGTVIFANSKNCLYALRALHSSHITPKASESNDHRISIQERLTEPELEFASWLVILYRHSTGKAVDVMTSLHTAEGMKWIQGGIETFTLRLVRRHLISDITGPDSEVLLIHEIL